MRLAARILVTRSSPTAAAAARTLNSLVSSSLIRLKSPRFTLLLQPNDCRQSAAAAGPGKHSLRLLVTIMLSCQPILLLDARAAAVRSVLMMYMKHAWRHLKVPPCPSLLSTPPLQGQLLHPNPLPPDEFSTLQIELQFASSRCCERCAAQHNLGCA
jgi:hypothetical protein